MNKHLMAFKSSELAVAPGFYSFYVNRHDNNNIWQNSEASSLPASDDLQNLWWRQLLVSNFWWECFWWRQLLMIFRTPCLQNLFSSNASLQHKLPFCRFHCSHLFFRTYAWIKETKFLSMVLHTWTNISISNWQFLIPCYHQNSKGNVKHILFQQCSPFSACLRFNQKMCTYVFGVKYGLVW